MLDQHLPGAGERFSEIMAAYHEAKRNPSDKRTLELQSRILQFGNLALGGLGHVFVPESLVSVPEGPVAKKVKME